MREMVRKDQPRFRGWACSQCGWVFNPVDPPSGDTFDVMVQAFKSRRDREFAAHNCAEYPPNLEPEAEKK